jgi:hypothetical protein
MPPAGFEPKISAGERPQTYALDRAVTGTGDRMPYRGENINPTEGQFKLQGYISNIKG